MYVSETEKKLTSKHKTSKVTSDITQKGKSPANRVSAANLQQIEIVVYEAQLLKGLRCRWGEVVLAKCVFGTDCIRAVVLLRPGKRDVCEEMAAKVRMTH